MAIASTTVIDNAKIKTRWEEPYVSAAINRELSVIPRGVYRGFEITEKSTPGKGITVNIKAGEDSILVFKDRSNGFVSSVRYDENFDIDFDFDASSSSVTLYVWCDVSYAVSSATSGSIFVGDGSDRSTDSITIAKIVIPLSATTVLDAYITQDCTDSDTIIVPDPVSSDWGMINETIYNRIPSADEKDGLSNASPSASASNPYVTESSTIDKVLGEPNTQIFSIPPTSASQVQLTGWYYVGNGGVGTAAKWFSLFESTSTVESSVGLTRTDTKDEITLTVYDSTNTSQLNPGVDATNGYYQNPYLRFSPTIDVTDFAVYSILKTDYANLDSDGLARLPEGIQAPINPFVIKSFYEQTRRRPATYTVSANSDDSCDFNGSESLRTALQWLSALGGGIIFVHKGDYTLTSGITIAAPIKIICEGSGTSSGERCRLTMSHSSGYGITFQDAVEIDGLNISASGKDAIQCDAGCDLRNVYIVGDVYLNGGNYTLLKSVDIQGFTGIAGTHLQIQCDSCTFQNIGTTPYRGLYMEGVIQRAMFNNCYIGAGYLGGNASGFALAGDIELALLVFNNTTFVCRGDYRAFKCDVGVGAFNQIKQININDCYVTIYSGNTSGDASFYISPSDGLSMSINGLSLRLGYTSGSLEAPLFQIDADNANEGGYDINVTGLSIQGYSDVTPIELSGSSPRAAIIATIADNGSKQGGVIRFDGIRSSHFTAGQTTGSTFCNLMEVANEPADTLLSVRGLVTFEHGGLARMAALGYSDITYVELFVNTEGYGAIEIEDCFLDGSDIRASGTETVRGIFVRTAGTHAGRVYIRNCTILEYVLNDIYVSSEETDVVLDGIKGVGHADITGTRWSFHSAKFVQIVNCQYRSSVSSGPDCIDFTTTNISGLVIGNNIIIMGAAADRAIDVYGASNSGTLPFSIVSNMGTGKISYKSTDTIFGVNNPIGFLNESGLTADPLA